MPLKSNVSRRMTLLPAVEAWRSSFGAAFPAGFLCRASLPERWLRIHSLPESKRYPETDAEQSELLTRQNAAADYALGESANCILFITRFGDSKRWSSSDELPLSGLTPEHVLSCEEGEDHVQFFALNLVWRTGSFDELILAAAEDRTGPLMFANTVNRSAYAPYDGGADLFFPTSVAVGVARRRFSEWLSKREDGL